MMALSIMGYSYIAPIIFVNLSVKYYLWFFILGNQTMRNIYSAVNMSLNVIVTLLSLCGLQYLVN